MVTQNRLQINRKLQKPKISDLHDTSNLKSSLSHHTNKGLIKVASYLAGIGNFYRKIFPSVATIARMCDLGEDQVIRILKEGEKMGLWKITRRKDFPSSGNKFGILSNLYNLNPLFFDMNWRNTLTDIIPAFKYLPLSLLLITTRIMTENNTINLKNSSSRKEAGIYLDYNSYIKKHKAYRAHAREEFSICTMLSKKEKHKTRTTPEVFTVVREKLMMNDKIVLYDNAVFSESVRKAGKELAMSCAGMCSISSFNDMVINVALKRISSYSKTINNPYGLFVNLCNAVSKEMNIPAKHNKAYALASQFDIKLGKDAAVLDDGNTPREPIKRKDEKFSAVAQVYQSSTHKVYNFPLEVLKKKNLAISMVGVEFVSPGVVRIQRHTDTQWRETTQYERDIWVNNMKEVQSRTQNMFLKLIPIEPPLMFHGDPNYPAFVLYHINEEGIMHSPDSNTVGCRACDKKKPVGRSPGEG